jgi:hypothetical protein
MRCHIIVSLELICFVESRAQPKTINAGAESREQGRVKKDRPIAATLKRRLLTKSKRRCDAAHSAPIHVAP